MNTNNNIIRLKTYTDNLKIIISLNDKLLQSIFQQNSINNKLTHLQEQLEFSNELVQKNKTFLYTFLDTFSKKHPIINGSKKYNNINNQLNRNSINVLELHINILNIQIEQMTKIQYFFQNIKNIQNKTAEALNKKQNINQLKKKKKNLENILKKK
jgi:hypothetical protein